MDIEKNINIEPNKTLNKDLFDGNKLKTSVKDKLLEISNSFIEDINLKDYDIEVIDYILTGSNVNYNYNKDSDLDLHILVDINEKNKDLFKDFGSHSAKNFNDKYDINVNGNNVELYVQDVNEDHQSNGVYSLLNDEFIKVPDNTKHEVNKEKIKNDYKYFVDKINNGDCEDYDDIKKELKKYRARGLNTKKLEYSDENLTYKLLRNTNKIDKLHDKTIECVNDELSLSEGEEVEFKFEYGCLMLQCDSLLNVWNKVVNNIDKKDVYWVKGYGLENKPHVTILFGFHDHIKFDDIKPFIKDYLYGKKSIPVSITGVSCFKNDDFEVLKFSVESDVLNDINKIMTDNFEFTNSYPDYVPHITIAYMKKGTCDNYIKDFNKKYEIKEDRLKYSYPNETYEYSKISEL